MATYTKYTNGVKPLLEGINSATAAWKIALALTVNSADTSFTAGTSDLVTGGGYTQGGNAATVVSSLDVGGTYTLILNSPSTWTASSAGFTFRYVILYDFTTGVPVGYWDYGTNVAMSGTNGDTFAVTLNATNGVFQVA